MDRIVIIPAYNPDEKLEKLVEENCFLENEVIVIDDGSDNQFQKIFWNIEKYCIVLHHNKNKGKGAAIKTALNYIKDELPHCNVIGIMDADGQHLTEDMEYLMNEAANNAKSLVVGARRIDQKMPWKSRFGNKITRGVFHLITGVTLSDTQSGLRAFSRDLLETFLNVYGDRYEYETNVLLMCAKKNIPIHEFSIHTIYHDKENSCSHFRKFRDSVRIYKDLLKFALFSLTGFAIDYILFTIFAVLLPKTAMALTLGNISARIVSGYYNYRMNCRFVFHQHETMRTTVEYIGLASAILFANSIILNSFVFLIDMPIYIAKILTELMMFLISWMIQNKVIFLVKRQSNDQISGGQIL